MKPLSGPSSMPNGLKLCLAGSGGGHVRQLLDLKPIWVGMDHFFVTEETALGYSIAKESRAHLVPHVALGQARLGRHFDMIKGGIANLIRSWRYIAREKPDVVITTGAGAVFFATLFARLRGATIVLIDSFARFERPSVFARFTAPLAHHKVVQSQALLEHMPGARFFDPLRKLEGPRPDKQPLMFVTVGATLPFDRMIQTVAAAKAEGLIPERVIAQVGVGGVRPEGLETVETLDFDEVQSILKEADLVICHGGTGSLITALREGCRVIVMPREFGRGEHYDDHQLEISTSFQARDMVTMARNDEEFSKALSAVRSTQPVMATTDPSALMNFLRQVLEDEHRARRFEPVPAY